jgi:hypothetical protein
LIFFFCSSVNSQVVWNFFIAVQIPVGVSIYRKAPLISASATVQQMDLAEEGRTRFKRAGGVSSGVMAVTVVGIETGELQEMHGRN